MKKRPYMPFDVRRLHIVCLFPALWLGLTGCKSVPSWVDASPVVTHEHIALNLASASSAYYATFGYWPLSPDNLRLLQTGQVSADWREEFSNSVKHIPWEDVKGKWTFGEKPDGSLEISMPPLDPPDKGGGGTVTVQKPIIPKR